MPPTSAHFNGSVNLEDAESVMREIAARVPTGLRRMTEGETGDRGNWIVYQFDKLGALPEFEIVSRGGGSDRYDEMPQLRLAPDVTPDEITWPELGYADAYLESFATFEALRAEGTIPDNVRFQVEYPTPQAVMTWFSPEDQSRLVGPYSQQLYADLAKLLAGVPHERLAVQWDVAIEIGLLVGAFGAPLGLDSVVPGLARCVAQVPGDVAVGMHLCYGDFGHQHFVQPESLRLQVDLVNALVGAAKGTIDWFSFTVPQNQIDENYFAPLRDLRSTSDTELAFALVPYHPDAQPPGTAAVQTGLIDTYLAESSAGVRDWAVGTECGMGRVAREDVPRLLDRYREIIAA